MREINLLVIHCSDSDIESHDNLETIRKWHVDENGWSDIGYHFLITKNGKIHKARPVERSGAHTKGFNKNSIGICLTGRKEFTEDQFESLRKLVKDLIEKYELKAFDVVPHNELDKSKTCPNFDIYKVISEK